ncbi:DUF1538 family protein [Roseateles sp.]|uniref:DUF1538 family protein n=1 Tax=Roseateles sp. TaxID=1971397 RepID=UPI0039ED3F3A
MEAALSIALVGDTAASVLLAVLPLALFFLVFQVFVLKLPGDEVKRILVGTALAAAGLFLFLLGVSIAFLPFGRAVGQALGALQSPWQVVAIGMLLGFVTTWGEPAVRILATEVEEASSGAIRRSWVLVSVCVGVAVAVGAGMFRVGRDLPLLYLLLPGYLLVVAIMIASRSDFVAIAADAGGVATGPLANSFLLALALGAAAATDGADPLVDGLGLVSLIALAPMVSLTSLGLLIRFKERRFPR